MTSTVTNEGVWVMIVGARSRARVRVLEGDGRGGAQGMKEDFVLREGNEEDLSRGKFAASQVAANHTSAGC